MNFCKTCTHELYGDKCMYCIAFASEDDNIINIRTTNPTMCECGSEIEHFNAEHICTNRMWLTLAIAMIMHLCTLIGMKIRITLGDLLFMRESSMLRILFKSKI